MTIQIIIKIIIIINLKNLIKFKSKTLVCFINLIKIIKKYHLMILKVCLIMDNILETKFIFSYIYLKSLTKFKMFVTLKLKLFFMARTQPDDQSIFV